MMQIKMENGMAKVFTPYNSEFVSKIKNVGGRKWNGAEKCWMVPESEVGVVRDIMMHIWGETDIPDDNKRVTVEVTFDDEFSARWDDVMLFGKVIAHATGRDSGAKVGDDVTLISGRVTSGGSVKNWYSVVKKGTVVHVRNVPENLVASMDGCVGLTVKVLPEREKDITALLAEKEKLLARLAEIEKELQE